jgi:hypothetical protein
MLVCIYHQNDGQEHCYTIPVIVLPFRPGLPGPNPINYPFLMQDAMIVGSLQDLASHVADEEVRKALHEGFAAAVTAMQARAGSGVTIKPSETA